MQQDKVEIPGEEDEQEAGEPPDVDEGGMLPLTPLFKAKVLSSTKMFILLLRPIPLTGRVKWVRSIQILDTKYSYA